MNCLENMSYEPDIALKSCQAHSHIISNIPIVADIFFNEDKWLIINQFYIRLIETDCYNNGK